MARAPEVVFVGQALPAAAVQALYHAATGKTENLSKFMRKNYIICRNDLDQLYLKIKQQLEHYNVIGGPTVSINVTFDNKEYQQFSSWDRFNLFDVGKTEVVENITIKVEFIIKTVDIALAPDAKTNQRYIIDIDVDSQLAQKKDNGFMRMRRIDRIINEYGTFYVSIDFVDYVIAKNILRTVEEWFSSIETASNPQWLIGAARHLSTRHIAFLQMGYLGAALFIATFSSFTKMDSFTFHNIAYIIASALLLFYLTSLLCRELMEYFVGQIIMGIIPPSLLLTRGDERAMVFAKEQQSKSLPAFLKFIAGLLLALSLNVLASYIYALATK